MSSQLILTFLLVTLLQGQVCSQFPPSQPVGNASYHNLTTPQLCARDGYPSETHFVVTGDNYILTIHRIPGSPLGPTPAPGVSKPVVFLQHGLLDSSATFLLNSEGKRLGYLLADRGYDVWLGNLRGNMYSRAHMTLSPNDPKFWNFTYHQSGIYDLPVMIDYVLEKTNQSQLNYIGHSMGTTTFFVMTSQLPAYNAKIKVGIMLAPVAFTQNLTSPIHLIANLFLPGVSLTDILIAYLATSGTGEFSPSGSMLQEFKNWACQDQLEAWTLCTTPNFVEYGFDPAQVNQSLVEELNGHFPAGSSADTVIHLAQGINGWRFRQYDYGVVQNERIYNAPFPPDYPLANITAPIYLISGSNDWLADPTDVATLKTKLQPATLKQHIVVSYKAWNHVDFLTAIDVNIYLHPQIFTILANNN